VQLTLQSAASDTVQSGRWVTTFQRHMQPSSCIPKLEAVLSITRFLNFSHHPVLYETQKNTGRWTMSRNPVILSVMHHVESL
jgi:hypothetical protein